MGGLRPRALGIALSAVVLDKAELMPLGIMHDHDDPLVVVVPLDGGAVFSNHAEALVEAQDWAWSIVFWCFCFALVLGAGSRIRIRGRARPRQGRGEDLDAPPASPAPRRR